MTTTKFTLVLTMSALSLTSCEDPDDLFDPRNPDLTIDAVVGTPNSAGRLLLGCERQLAIAYNEILPITEIASDNYVNTQTFFNTSLDDLEIDFRDADLNDTQFALARLRAIANLGLETIGPGDENYTAAQNASFLYFRGLSQLLLGSYFSTAPSESGGVLRTRNELYVAAVADFTDALALNQDAPSLLLARARANYQAGQCDAASTDAQALLDAAPEFVRYVMFDVVEGVPNTFQDAIADRASFDDLQPLPRLDFLDPKYSGILDATNDFDIPYLKAEEAHFILAEAALSGGDVDEARTQMLAALDLISVRPQATFDDSSEGRIERAPSTRPDTATAIVASAPGANPVEGLILDRGEGPVTVPSVSGTSVSPETINELDDVTSALEILYLMRQEVFIAEGRRFIDLGLTFTPSERELLLNDNVTTADVEPVIPDFIAANRENLDAFTYDAAAGEVTIAVDFNSVIVENRESEFVVPCF